VPGKVGNGSFICGFLASSFLFRQLLINNSFWVFGSAFERLILLNKCTVKHSSKYACIQKSGL